MSTTTAPAVPAAASQAVTLWGIVKGVAEAAITVLSIVDPPAGVALGTSIALVDVLVSLLPMLEAGSEQLLASVGAIQGHSQTVLIAAAPSITVIPNKT